MHMQLQSRHECNLQVCLESQVLSLPESSYNTLTCRAAWPDTTSFQLAWHYIVSFTLMSEMICSTRQDTDYLQQLFYCLLPVQRS